MFTTFLVLSSIVVGSIVTSGILIVKRQQRIVNNKLSALLHQEIQQAKLARLYGRTTKA